MTLRQLTEILAAAGISDAKNDTLLLASAASGSSYASLFASQDEDISEYEWYHVLTDYINRRKAREPLQYILGRWSFYGDDYIVSPDCLIPRPETEMLVDYALSHLPRGALIADFCCGSGAIGIALCKHGGFTCHSFDISDAAIKMAEKNADALGVTDKITFNVTDILKPGAVNDRYDMILCNPPYIKTADMKRLEPELFFEPAIALDGGVDGMIFYRSIINNCKRNLFIGGVFVFEIGADEGDDIMEIAISHGCTCTVKPDLSGCPRMAIVTLP